MEPAAKNGDQKRLPKAAVTLEAVAVAVAVTLEALAVLVVVAVAVALEASTDARSKRTRPNMTRQCWVWLAK